MRSLDHRNRELCLKNDSLAQQLEQAHQQVGVPKREYEFALSKVKQKDKEIERLEQEIEDRKTFMTEKETLMTQERGQRDMIEEQLKRKQSELENRDEEVVILRAKLKELQEALDQERQTSSRNTAMMGSQVEMEEL